jgi:ElaB/YqjD/DUF883 family membrane-anchored ribosome-binding protein
METTANGMANKGQALADKAADNIQSGIRDAKYAANSTASSLSSGVESLRSNAKPTIQQAADQADGLLTRGMSAVTDATQKVRDAVADTQDSIVTYTKDNPVKALLIAAATGAVLVGLIRALTPSRD